MKFTVFIISFLFLAEPVTAKIPSENEWQIVQFSEEEAVEDTSVEGKGESLIEIWWKSAEDYFNSIFQFNSDDFSFPSIETQIFRQLGPLTLLNLAPLSKEELIDKLQTDFNISIVVDDPTIFNKYMLSYLYLWFEMMLPAQEVQDKAYSFYAAQSKGQVLVSREENNIYFSKTAGIKTINHKFNEVIDLVFENKTFAGGENISITFDYSNELYHQLNTALLNSQHIKDFIATHTGVQFGVDPTDPLYPRTKEFTFEELLTILKQFLDLPEHIRTRLKLKRIVQMEAGENLANSAALYSVFDQMIQIKSDTFESNPRGGGDIILHELGHALWYGLSKNIQKKYEEISWGENTIGNFVSHYSTKNVEEDFAEHFMMYINNSERLKNKVREKYDWLKEYIFFNTEYFSSAPENLKIFLESDLEDITPPVWGSKGQLKVSLQPEAGRETESLYLIGDVSNIFDDVSGVKEIYIEMRLTSGAEFVAGANEPLFDVLSISVSDLGEKDECRMGVCVYQDASRPGWYLIMEKENRNSAYRGWYEVSAIQLEDYAGNERWLNFGGKKSIFFPGTRKPKIERSREEQELLSAKDRQSVKNKTKIKAGQLDREGTLAVLYFPDIENWDSVDKIIVYAEGEETKKTLGYTVKMEDLPYLQSIFNIDKEPGFLSFPFVIPKQMRNQKYVVKKISFISSLSLKSYDRNRTNVYTAIDFNHFSLQEDRTMPQPVVENIQLTSRYGVNQQQQGTAVITAKIPVEGFSAGRGDYTVVLRSPQGKILQAAGKRKNVKTDSEGRLYIQAVFPLDPYYAEGEYILSGLTLYEYYDSTNIPSEMNIHGNYTRYEGNFVERNIRKTIKVTVPDYSSAEQD